MLRLGLNSFLNTSLLEHATMFFHSWLRVVTPATKRAKRLRDIYRPRIEPLETREVLSTVLEVGTASKFAFHTIQSAVDAARPGDTVRVHSGTYLESVVVSKPRLTIVGAARDHVVIQNPDEERIGVLVTADPTVAPSETAIPTATLDGFTLANVTVTGFAFDGVLLFGVKHFVLSRVTATGNDEYGLFPIFSAQGVVADCTASGSNDTGIYVGQSHDIVVAHNQAFDNVNGIEIENSTRVVATNNNVHDNTVGILEDLLPGLSIESSSYNVIAGNRVLHNNRPNSASPEDIAGAEPSGVGIAIVGGDHTVVVGNRVSGNNTLGIVVLSLADLLPAFPIPYPPNVDPNPNNTLIVANVVTGNGLNPDPVLGFGADLGWSGKGQNNRWLGNTFGTSNVPLPK